MIGRLKLLVGFGVGYVLGARAGRERYTQIAGKARDLWSDPRVQGKAGQAQQVVKEKADQAQQVVKEKVGDKIGGTGTSASSVSSRTGAGSKTGSGTVSSPTR